VWAQAQVSLQRRSQTSCLIAGAAVSTPMRVTGLLLMLEMTAQGVDVEAVERVSVAVAGSCLEPATGNLSYALVVISPAWTTLRRLQSAVRSTRLDGSSASRRRG